MKIYIAGKITGNDIYYAEFLTAEIELKNKGHIVFNPTTLPLGLEHEQYKSKGAKEEMEYANSKGKKIIYLEE